MPDIPTSSNLHKKFENVTQRTRQTTLKISMGKNRNQDPAFVNAQPFAFFLLFLLS